MSDFETVLLTPELGPGNIAEVRAHGRGIGVANVGQTYYAFEAECPVDGTNLARNGRLEGDLLICPNDQARFDIRTGERVDNDHTGHTNGSLRAHDVRIQGNEVMVGPERYAGDNVR